MRRSLVSLLLIALVGSLALVGWRAFERLEFDASIEVLLAGDRRSSASFGQVRNVVGEHALLIVLMEVDDAFTPATQRLLTDVGDELDALDGVREVVSLVHSIRPARLPGFVLDPRDALENRRVVPRPGEGDPDWEALREFAAWWPGSRDLLVSTDSRVVSVLVVVDRPLPDQAARLALREDVRSVVDKHAQRAKTIQLFGFPLMEAEILETVQGDLSAIVGMVLGLVLLILLISFRSPPIILSVLVMQALGLGVLALVLELDSGKLNLYSAILFPLVSGLQLTFLTHLLASLQRQRQAGAGVGPAADAAVRAVFGPSLIAAATSVLGLLSLEVCDVAVVRAFGELGAIAVTANFVLVFGLAWLVGRLPGAPAVIGDAAVRGREERWGRWLARRLAERRGVVLGAGALLIVILIPGALSLRADVRAAEYLDPASESRAALATLDESLGGLNTFILEVDCGQPGGAYRRDALAFMGELADHTREFPGVTSVYTWTELLSAVNRIFEYDDPAADQLPESDMLLAVFGAAVRGTDFPLTDLLLDDEARVARFIVRTRDMPGNQYIAMLDDVLAYAAEHRPEGVQLIAREGVHSLIEADRRLVESQLWSLATGGALVMAALMLLWRSVRMALLALVVNLPAMLSILALFGWADLPLNSVTIMVSAVVLGVAVDDSIHLLAYHSRELRRSGDPRLAIERTLQRKLRPMMTTSAILVSGLGLLAVSRFPPVANFGLAAGVSLSVALGGVMLLLPALVFNPASQAARARADVQRGSSSEEAGG